MNKLTGESMGKKFSRREFIKISGIGAIGSAALANGAFQFVPGSMEKGIKNGALTKTPTYCEMCTFKCAGWVYKKDGKPWKIIGNEIDEHSYGRLCTKGSAGLGAYSDPDRLKTPLIRTTDKSGKQVFRKATWDEALNYIADKMKVIKEKYGPESMALFTHGAGGSFFKTLLKAYGSNNVVAPSYGNCRGPREEAYLLTVGDAINSPECTDMKNSNCECLNLTSTNARDVMKYGHHEKCDKKRCFVRIALKDEPKNGYIERPENLDALADMLRDECECEGSNGYILTPVLMSEREFRSLDEFEGF